MKTSFSSISGLLAVLGLGSLFGGCNASTSTPAEVARTATQLEASAVTSPVAAAESGSALAATAPSTDEMASPAAPEVPLGVERPLPENIKSRTALAEVVKLAQSGVDQTVLMSFVENSKTGFALGADEVIFLNDLGVPSHVITAMLERDKELNVSSMPVGTVATGAGSDVALAVEAAAPSYVSEPIPETNAPAEVVTEETFKEALSPYGTWINIDGYGACWQPSVVVIDNSWRPYSHGGRWIYTDCGWYWYSDYTWGWAPFHYGRWFRHSRWGWCWYPGYTWGPSWVSWRYTDGYCGWAPLPPAACYTAGIGFSWYGSSVGWNFGFGLGYSYYNFVPWGSFCDYRPYRHCAPSHLSRNIYDRSTVVNNVIVGDNNTIINRGIPVEHVSAVTRTEIRKVPIREAGGGSRIPTRGERLSPDGRSIVLQRPRTIETQAGVGSAAVTRQSRGEVRASSRSFPSAPAVSTAAETGISQPRGSRVERTIASPVAPARGIEVADRPVGPGRGVERAARPASLVHGTPVRAETPSGTPRASAPVPVQSPATSDKAEPRGSLVVIGKRETTPARNAASLGEVRAEAPQRIQPEASARPASSTPVVRNPIRIERSASAAPPATGAPQRAEVTRVSRGIQDRPSGSPAYSVWTPAQAPSTAPAARTSPGNSAAAPSRSYSAPIAAPSAPAPSYSSPRATPAPARSAPAAPAPVYRSAPAQAPAAPRAAPAPAAPRSAPAPAGRSEPGPRRAR